MVVGGFEPVDLLEAILMLVTQLEEGGPVENQYVRSVSRDGNLPAQQVLERSLRSRTGNGAASA